MTRSSGTSRNTSKAGSYYRAHPLDFELLRRMPREGSMLGFHTLGMTVAHVLKELNKIAPEGGKLKSSQIQARLRAMHIAGHVTHVTVMGSGGTQGWQRTVKGEQHYVDNTGESLSDTAATELKIIEGGRT